MAETKSTRETIWLDGKRKRKRKIVPDIDTLNLKASNAASGIKLKQTVQLNKINGCA